MSLYEIPTFTGGYDNALISMQNVLPIFIPMFLFFVFGFIFLGGAIAQRRREGSSDFPMWCTMASLGTLLVALPLTLVAGVLQLEVLVILVVLTITSGSWLFFDRNKNEVF